MDGRWSSSSSSSSSTAIPVMRLGGGGESRKCLRAPVKCACTPPRAGKGSSSSSWRPRNAVGSGTVRGTFGRADIYIRTPSLPKNLAAAVRRQTSGQVNRNRGGGRPDSEIKTPLLLGRSNYDYSTSTPQRRGKSTVEQCTRPRKLYRSLA